ncbi:hypothetical protein G6L37_34750 [Agrobacterium rubi]|nr:hypothetical protein [Agrobacterium rubi]NTF23728.1 hypothetical protein [Agrobacterium rubi]
MSEDKGLPRSGRKRSGKPFYAEGTAVRFADGRPCCVTSHSIHLDANPDPNVGYAEKSWDRREDMAAIIAQALNQYFEERSSRESI